MSRLPPIAFMTYCFFHLLVTPISSLLTTIKSDDKYDLLIILSNNANPCRDQEYFCGQGSWTRTSTSNRLTIGFHSDGSNPPSSKYYRFQCTISVLEESTPTPSCACGQSSNGVGHTFSFLK